MFIFKRHKASETLNFRTGMEGTDGRNSFCLAYKTVAVTKRNNIAQKLCNV